MLRLLLMILLACPAYGVTQRTFHVTAPVVVTAPELTLQISWQFMGIGAIGLEYFQIGEKEEYSEARREEDLLSLVTSGQEAALTFSRFSSPWDMSGFYWTLGMGYRALDALWKHPDLDGLALANNYDVDDEGRLTHEFKVSGMTGHGRLGYRYVGERFPFIVGGYLGIRHYESKFIDGDSEDNPESTEDQRYSLRRLIMTRPVAALEFGVTF